MRTLYWFYVLSWILLFFVYLSPQLDIYIRSLGYGVAVTHIILFTLIFIKELVLT